jgi:integrase
LTTTVGTVFDQRNYRRSFTAVVKRIGLPMIRVHDMRHTCATLLSRGVHPKIVQELLGHSQISLTMDMYSPVLPPMQEEAARVMEGVLAGA